VGAPASIGAGGRSSKPTDSDGFFSIEPAPSVTIGTPITVQIQKDGFQTFTRQIDYTGVSQVITLEDDNPTVKPGTVKPTNKPRVQTQPPVAGATGPAQPPAPLRSPTGDVIIDSVQERLNSLRSDATDAQTTSILRGLFEAPIFGSIGEELSEDALYRFCRTKRILMHYQLRFGAPEV
jgi:hypothetical protein